MKTSDLIASLAADSRAPTLPLKRRLAVAFGAGALVSLALFMAMVGPRPDVMSAMHTMRFDLKFLDTLALLAPSYFLCLSLARPETGPNVLFAWLAAPLLLLLTAVGVELAVVPRDLWVTRLVGSNWYHCLTVIPLLSIAPLGALIAALREGAPRYPALAGALAGAASAGVAATIYASNCPDDSPLFVVTWYPLATAIVVAIGAIAGWRWLRW
jgi:hypothetical protein